MEEPIGENDRFSEKLLPIFELLDQLDQAYHTEYDVSKNEVHHNLLMGTDPSYRTQNIPYLFLKFCTDIAREKGFKTMLTEVTGPVSYYVSTQKLGFEELHSIRYADFEFNGTYPFRSIEDVEYCFLVHRPMPKENEIFVG